jgi:hypothetical protein
MFESLSRDYFPGQNSDVDQLSLVSLTFPSTLDMMPPRDMPHALWNRVPVNREPHHARETHHETKGEQIYHYLTDKYRLTPVQACGIIGNMQSESGLRSDAFNNGERAIGLCQWQGARSNHLKQFAQRQGTHHSDWHVQIDFMMHEFKGSESYAWSALRRAHTPQQAAVAFDRYYERSSGAARHQRIANATSVYQKAANFWCA